MIASRNVVARRTEATRTQASSAAGAFVSATAETGFWRVAASIRPGRNSIRVAALLTVLALVYFALPWRIVMATIVLVFLAFLSMAILEARSLMQSMRQLKVRRTVPPVIGRNAVFSLSWEIVNDSTRTIVGQLRDVSPQAATPGFATVEFELPAGRRTTLADARQIAVRGLHEFGPIWIRLIGTRRLVEIQLPVLSKGPVKVLPEQFASRDELHKDRGAEIRMLDKTTRNRQQGAGTEFESLTEFREGDDPRRIDWRATARIQRPVVRRFQIERHRDVMIVLDCGRLMGTDAGKGTKLDCAIDAALILARVALQSGDRCGMGLYDSEVRGYLPPVSGLPALRALTESVYAVQSDFRESDFGPIFAMLQARQSKRSLVVVLSDVVDAETSLQFRASLGLLGRRHMVLFAALRTPLLNRIVHEPVESMIDGAKLAVAFRLMQERQLALQSLRHQGVVVLDVEPSQLTAPLVNQFVELRQRNLL